MAEWIVILRRQWPVWKRHGYEWFERVRENPGVMWESVLVRTTCYILAGFSLIYTVQYTARMIAPPPPSGSSVMAYTGDHHVVCVNPSCGKHFVVHKGLRFSGYPVACSQCHQKTGMSARKCFSDACRGEWSAPIKTAEGVVCFRCGGKL